MADHCPPCTHDCNEGDNCPRRRPINTDEWLACYRRFRALGYSRTSSFRQAMWANDPDQSLYPEKK